MRRGTRPTTGAGGSTVRTADGSTVRWAVRRFGRTAAGPLACGTLAGLILLIATAAVTLAADPTASPPGGDVRTNPAAPGFVGDPVFAVLGVIVIGLLAVLATLAGLRLSARR